jgi:16S rRNA (cytosine967-C5)-methyltransferase
METREQNIPLWRQLQGAASVLQQVRTGMSGTAALASVPSELRPGVQALVFQTLRSLGRAQALRQLLAQRAPPPAADALLCTALALGWHDQDAPYEVFTLVNQTVEAAKRSPATQAQTNFINACLRRFIRERDTLVSQTDENSVAVWNHPQWWIDRLQREWPADWQAILAANNRHAPMTLRVNVRQSNVAAFLKKLGASGLEATATGQFGVTLLHPCPVQDIPGFSEGKVSVQDAAAQLAAPLLLDGLASTTPLYVLDACAAPGGKTAHLLEFANCTVTALELDPLRCEKIHQTLHRLSLQANVVVADAANVPSWWDGKLFDAILLDAPCSAAGIVRRHPDVRWLRRETDIAQLAGIQSRLLKALWRTLKQGGRLLYCTCSVFKSEGAGQIEAFLARNMDANLLPSPGHLLPGDSAPGGAVLDNLYGDHDGFYYALLEKRSA